MGFVQRQNLQVRKLEASVVNEFPISGNYREQLSMFSLSNQLLIPRKADIVYFTDEIQSGLEGILQWNHMEVKKHRKRTFLLVLFGRDGFYPVIYRSVSNAVKTLCSLLVVSVFYHVKVNTALLVRVIRK